MAEGLHPEGLIHTIDNNEELVTIQDKYFGKSDFRSNIKQYSGNAIEILPKFNCSFDLAFIDADKENYLVYYESVLSLLRTGGLLLIDNVLWGGSVVDPEKNDDDTNAIRSLNRHLLKDDRVVLSMLPVGDGLTLVMKKRP